jgi:hypothetical protein
MDGLMDEKQLKAAIKSQITNAVGYADEISEERQKSLRDYMGEPLGNEIDGRSQVISTDVQDVIESVMPDVIRIFTASDQAVQFQPVGQEDEEIASRATDYVNHIWNVDNGGFNIFHDWFKDALLQKNGIIKIWWDDSEKTEKRKYTGLTDDQLAALMDDKDVEVLENTDVIDPQAEQMMAQLGIDPEALPEQLPPELAGLRTHKVTIKRTTKRGRVKIRNVPPEEFLVSRRATHDERPFCAHRTTPTQSQLIADGYDPDQIDSLPDGDDDVSNAEKTQRFKNESGTDEEIDRATRQILVHECFAYVDWDDDGIAELRKITVGGPQYEILKFKDGREDNEEISEDPFAVVGAIRMPHKFWYRSLAELCQDIQYIKTSIWRQTLDNMYNINNGRAAISNKVSIEDYLDNKVGAPIRVDTTAGDVGGHIFPVQTPSIGNHAFPLLEYVDTVRETRTGVNRLAQGLDPDAMKNTATGINQLLGRSQQRTLMIAEVFANGGVKDAFKKILRIVIENQDEPRKIKLRKEWVDIDPRSWNAEMNLTTDVGLGRGTQDQQIATMAKVLELQHGIIQLQGGVNGPLVNLHNLSNGASKLLEATGIKSADPYIMQVSEEQAQAMAEQSQQQPPPPEIMLEQMKQQGAQQQAQMTAQLAEHKATLEAQGKQAEHMMTMEKLGAERDLEAARFRNKQFDLDAEAQRTAIKTAAHESETAMNLAAKEHEKAMDVAAHQHTTEVNTAAAERKAKAAAKKPKKAAA